jgi:hypothetical protein
MPFKLTMHHKIRTGKQFKHANHRYVLMLSDKPPKLVIRLMNADAKAKTPNPVHCPRIVLCEDAVVRGNTHATSSSIVVGELNAHAVEIYQDDGGQMGLAWPQASALQQPRKPLPQTW